MQNKTSSFHTKFLNIIHEEEIKRERERKKRRYECDQVFELIGYYILDGIAIIYC